MASLLNMSGGSLLKKVDPFANYTLIHHWEASDLQSNYWNDRVEGRGLLQKGNPVKETIDGVQYLKLNTDNCFYNANINYFLDMGDEWIVELSFFIPAIPSDKSNWLADFGSLESAFHAFGFSVSTNGMFGFNPKLDGNTSGTLYNIPNINCNINTPTEVILGMEQYDNTNNILFAVYNGVKYYSPNSIVRSKATFSKNFHRESLYIGRGLNVGAQTQDYKYIKSLKIYKK